MNHPIVLRIQANDAFEQVEIPIVHKQILRCEAIAEWESESGKGHNVFTEVESSCEDDRYQKHGQ
jgi:hypothetical protein